MSYNTQVTYEFPEMQGDLRLRELILYIAEKSADDPNFGAIKLNKVLFFADFIHYMQTGKPITGVKYMHLKNGAVPQRMIPIRDEMLAEREIHITKKQVYAFEQQRVVPLRSANIDEYFKAGEIALVDEIIRVLWGKNAKEASILSHGTAWKVFSDDRELIPYEAALLSDDGITADDISRTGELALKYGW
jgi:hypothetical protein